MSPSMIDFSQLPPPADDGTFVWRCATCPRVVPFGNAELAQFARDGWPLCCGTVAQCFFYAPSEG